MRNQRESKFFIIMLLLCIVGCSTTNRYNFKAEKKYTITGFFFNSYFSQAIFFPCSIDTNVASVHEYYTQFFERRRLHNGLLTSMIVGEDKPTLFQLKYGEEFYSDSLVHWFTGDSIEARTFIITPIKVSCIFFSIAHFAKNAEPMPFYFNKKVYHLRARGCSFLIYHKDLKVEPYFPVRLRKQVDSIFRSKNIDTVGIDSDDWE